MKYTDHNLTGQTDRLMPHVQHKKLPDLAEHWQDGDSRLITILEEFGGRTELYFMSALDRLRIER